MLHTGLRVPIRRYPPDCRNEGMENAIWKRVGRSCAVIPLCILLPVVPTQSSRSPAMRSWHEKTVRADGLWLRAPVFPRRSADPGNPVRFAERQVLRRQNGAHRFHGLGIGVRPVFCVGASPRMSRPPAIVLHVHRPGDHLRLATGTSEGCTCTSTGRHSRLTPHRIFKRFARTSWPCDRIPGNEESWSRVRTCFGGRNCPDRDRSGGKLDRRWGCGASMAVSSTCH